MLWLTNLVKQFFRRFSHSKSKNLPAENRVKNYKMTDDLFLKLLIIHQVKRIENHKRDGFGTAVWFQSSKCRTLVLTKNKFLPANIFKHYNTWFKVHHQHGLQLFFGSADLLLHTTEKHSLFRITASVLFSTAVTSRYSLTAWCLTCSLLVSMCHTLHNLATLTRIVPFGGFQYLLSAP